MSIHQTILTFNGGETTYYLAHLTALDKHPSSALILENWLPMPFGGLRKRPGTIVLTKLDGPTRIEAFNYTTEEQFILAFQEDQLVVYDRDGEESDTIEAAFPAPFALQFAQINDVVFLTDGLRFPQRLSRESDTDWNLEDVPFTKPPLLDENDQEQLKITTSFPNNTGASAWAPATSYAVGARVTHSGDYWACNAAHVSSNSGSNGPPGTGTYVERIPKVTGRYTTYENVTRPLWTRVSLDGVSAVGQEISLTSNFDYFTANHVGMVLKIAKKRALTAYEVTCFARPENNGKTSPVLVVQGGWSFQTFGNWNGTFVIQISRDRGDTWIDHRSFQSDGERNVSPTGGTETERVLMRVKWLHDESSGWPKGILTASGNYISGLVKITAVTDANTATGIALSPVEGTTTEFWTESAFNPLHGYPNAVGVHDSRLVFFATSTHPLSLWMSRTDSLLDFTSTTDEDATDDDAGIFRTLAGRQQDPGRWIASQKYLFLGTAGGEWVIGSENTDKPISPTNFIAREHTNVGSAPLGAIKIGSSVYFVERQRRRLREFAFVYEADQYEAADLTRLAEHVTEGGIVQYAWQANREPTLWAVRADGVLLSFSYNRNERIAAWARHPIAGGAVRSVAVLRNEAGDDEVVLVVQRGEDFYLEKIAPGQQLIQEQGNLEDAHFVDGGVVAATDGNLEVAMPDFYENGAEVYSLSAGIFRKHTVDGGKIALPVASAKVHAGFPIVSRWQPLPIDIQTETGGSHGRNKQGESLRINVFKSWGGSVTYGGSERFIEFTNTGEPLDLAPEMVTGWKDVTFDAADVLDLTFTLEHSDPYPFTLRTAVLTWNLHEA